MNAPAILLVGSILVAVGAALARERPGLSGLVSALGAAALGGFAIFVPLDEAVLVGGLSLKIGGAWSILGRALVLDASNRAAVGFLYLVCGFLFAAGGVARPGRYFFAVGVLGVATVAASLMIRPFLYAAILVEMTAMGSVWLLAGRNRESHTGALRLLALSSMGMMAVLLAGWMVEAAGVAAGAPEVAARAALLLGLGFAILMALPPFHHWLPQAAQGSHPYAVTLVTTLLQSAGLFFLLRFLENYEWLRESPQLFQGMRWAGMAALLLGGTWGLVQSSFPRFVAYVLIADLGVSLLAISAHTADGYRMALAMVAARALGLAVWGLGAAALEASLPDEGAGRYRGAAQRAPLPVLVVFVGLLTLIGFPATAGFPARWVILEILSPQDVTAGLVLLGTAGLLTLSLARWMGVFLAPAQGPIAPPAATWRDFFLWGGVVLCLGLGLFPGLLGIVLRAGWGLPNLIP